MAPADTFEVKFPLYRSLFGMALKPGQAELPSWSNVFITDSLADSSLNAAWRKWFDSDLPEMPIPEFVNK
ncbi:MULTISPECIES: hypothetical protein [unclassified Mesorhizobium]|uniref:hypothetical protein n=1 Tax=unclassified Mesorhizobium TaxID=325217 RepID=UPI001FE05FCF|nr:MULTISPECIES: hypothetical protein [unclassified Mesorhizobium]